MALAIAAAAVLGLAVWVVRGFLRPAAQFDRTAGESGNLLAEAKHGVYRSMLDLEEDFALGKVSEPDRQILWTQYEAEALVLLRESRQQQEQQSDELHQALEREIAAARIRLAGERKREDVL